MLLGYYSLTQWQNYSMQSNIKTAKCSWTIFPFIKTKDISVTRPFEKINKKNHKCTHIHYSVPPLRIVVATVYVAVIDPAHVGTCLHRVIAR